MNEKYAEQDGIQMEFSELACDKCGFSYWVALNSKGDPINSGHSQEQCDKNLIKKIQTE